MRSVTNIVGILLILFGILALGYQGITYTKPEAIAKIGNIQLTENVQKSIFIPPLVGGLSLAVGIVLVIIGRIGKK